MGITTNLELSSRRADTVVSYLQSQGVSPNLMSAQGFGETKPVASNDTAAGPGEEPAHRTDPGRTGHLSGWRQGAFERYGGERQWRTGISCQYSRRV